MTDKLTQTDKEQKKWHEEKWGTNEEPEETPTERPHNPKNYEKAVCKHYCLGECSREFGNRNGNCVGTTKCIDNLIEQLTCKSQECEELKKELNSSEKWRIKAESLNEKLDIENTRYRNTLKEIKDYCSSKIKSDFDFIEAYTPILNIINKTKGKENTR